MQPLSRDNNFYYLCGSLLVILFSSSAIHLISGRWGQDLFSALILAMLLVSIKSLHLSLTLRKLVWVVVAMLFLLTLLQHTFRSELFEFLSLALLFLFFASLLHAAGRQVLFVGRVDSNRIIGSISLYLLLGLLWTQIYLFLLMIDPEAFQGLEAETWREAFPRAAYFSFVTLTTLGYGDILPTNPIARFFAYMEAVAGVFYMAIVVASLVSIGISRAGTNDPGCNETGNRQEGS
jgi:voltage-gated potassium channel Kch